MPKDTVYKTIIIWTIFVMNRRFSITVLSLFIFALANISVVKYASAGSAQKRIDWNDDKLEWFSYEEGIRKIKETGKPGLLVIYADWCPACQRHSRHFFHKEIVSMLQGVILIRVNKDKGKKISKLYDFDGEYIPRVFALDRSSKVIHELYNIDEKFVYFDPARSQPKLKRLIRGILKN